MKGEKKILYLLRHAKSAWDTNAPDDFSRPLNSRGARDAVKVGRWMKDKGFLPEKVISSPALRAWQTVTSVCHELKIDSDTIDFEKRIYLAEVSELSRIISTTHDEVKSLLLVGHNPGLEQLIEQLLAGELPACPDNKLLPTATLCVLKIDAWESLHGKPAHLSLIQRPKRIT